MFFYYNVVLNLNFPFSGIIYSKREIKIGDKIRRIVKIIKLLISLRCFRNSAIKKLLTINTKIIFRYRDPCIDNTDMYRRYIDMRRFTSTVPARGARALNRAISNSCL